MMIDNLPLKKNSDNDLQISDGDIILKNENFNKVIASYIINTTKNNKLGISNIVSEIIFNKSGLKLTTKQEFKQNIPTNNFKLRLKKYQYAKTI